jgi:hypothetical protein
MKVDYLCLVDLFPDGRYPGALTPQLALRAEVDCPPAIKDAKRRVVTSMGVTCSVGVANVFLSVEESLRVNAGEVASFTVKAVGNLPMEVTATVEPLPSPGHCPPRPSIASSTGSDGTVTSKRSDEEKDLVSCFEVNPRSFKLLRHGIAPVHVVFTPPPTFMAFGPRAVRW